MNLTPEERAAKVRAELETEFGNLYNYQEDRIGNEVLEKIIAAAIRAAVEAEREECVAACEKIADDLTYQEGLGAANRCVESIRSRSETTPEAK